jgi:hypothetical protein
MWTYPIPTMLGITFVVSYVLRAFPFLWWIVVIRSVPGFVEAFLETVRIYTACACENGFGLANSQSKESE